MMFFKKSFFSFLFAAVLLTNNTSYATTNNVSAANEESFKSVFISGGYGALFGGAMGAATIPFMHNTMSQNLRMIAAGTSLGFMVGSLYGFYNISQQSHGSTYFNYDPSGEGKEDPLYYSMPPTIPTQGNHPQEPPIYIGALFVGNIDDVHLGVPYFWIGGGQTEVMVAQITF
jgi:hypothetical protein